MVIRYTSTRSDVWRAYWQTWRHSPKLNVLRLFIFGWAFFVAWSQLTAFSMGPFWRLFSALALALTAMLLMAVSAASVQERRAGAHDFYVRHRHQNRKPVRRRALEQGRAHRADRRMHLHPGA